MNKAQVLVTGGTGVLGRRVVERLGSEGIRARVFSRSGKPGTMKGDLRTGEGLESALQNVEIIIHCATSPFRRARQVDVEGTGRLLEAAAESGVSHLLYISIVGIDRASSYPYYRIKLETERVVEDGPIPYTILRATQFYDLVLMALRFLDRLPAMVVPRGFLGQPIDAGEVAGCLVQLALSGPSGRATDIGGPEVRTLAYAARGYLRARGSLKRIFEVSVPGKTARAFREGALVCPDQAYGKIRWEDFLRPRIATGKEVTER